MGRSSRRRPKPQPQTLGHWARTPKTPALHPGSQVTYVRSFGHCHVHQTEDRDLPWVECNLIKEEAHAHAHTHTHAHAHAHAHAHTHTHLRCGVGAWLAVRSHSRHRRTARLARIPLSVSLLNFKGDGSMATGARGLPEVAHAARVRDRGPGPRHGTLSPAQKVKSETECWAREGRTE